MNWSEVALANFVTNYEFNPTCRPILGVRRHKITGCTIDSHQITPDKMKGQRNMKKSANTAQGAEQRRLVWHKLNSSSAEGRVFKLGNVYRAKVPGGWLVLVADNATGLTFYPDPEHNWDGGSLTA